MIKGFSSLIVLFFALQVFGGVDQKEVCIDKIALQIKMYLIASNIANNRSTRTPDGGPFQPYMNIVCANSSCNADRDTRTWDAYEPDHPDADESGYVAYPNTDLMYEMQNMIDTSRAYQSAPARCP